MRGDLEEAWDQLLPHVRQFDGTMCALVLAPPSYEQQQHAQAQWLKLKNLIEEVLRG